MEFFALDGRLHAVTVADGRAALHRLGDEAAVDKEVASLRFSLRSLATARPGLARGGRDGRRLRDGRASASTRC